MESEQEIRVMHRPLANPDLHFPDLAIEGFRGFRQLAIPQLGRVTLITGKNDTGKSSILEALHLHTQHAAPAIIHRILASREEYVQVMDKEASYFDPEREFPGASLFYGFPRLGDDFAPIVIATRGRLQPTKLQLQVEFLASDDSTEPRSLAVANEELFAQSETSPYLVVRTEEDTRIVSLDTLHRRVRGRSWARSFDRERMPCSVVSARGEDWIHILSSLWDLALMRGDEDEVVRALQVIEPSIASIWMIGGGYRSTARTAMVRTTTFPSPVPLRSLGNGLNRVFAIVLSLLNARGGILLIDEFENGIHHTAQLDIWRIIFGLAQRYDIQIFATTHSWDAVENFQKAAADSLAMGMLLHLFRRENDIYATIFAESELAVATRSRIEVR